MIAPAEVKACCAQAYSSQWPRLLLGESFHPGGLALTVRLGELLGLRPGQRVLDVACGTGASARVLAQRYRCRVVGLDFADGNLRPAARADGTGSDQGEAWLCQGDAERLPFADSSLDALICECAFCMFPDKAAAATEFARVLRPGGRVGLADLTASGALPDSLQGLLAWVACLADARPVSQYAAYLQSAGFAELVAEEHDEALADLARTVRLKLLGARVVLGLSRFPPPGGLDQALALARAAERAVRDGRLGYALLVGTRNEALRDVA